MRLGCGGRADFGAKAPLRIEHPERRVSWGTAEGVVDGGKAQSTLRYRRLGGLIKPPPPYQFGVQLRSLYMPLDGSAP